MFFIFFSTLCMFLVLYSVFGYKNNNIYILKHKNSQFNQDLSLYYHYFQKLEKGFFVEIGAYDGILLSNSYFFEKNFNWHGILIEGGERNCANLSSNSIYRNKSIIICSPICKLDYISYNENDYLGSIAKNDKLNKKYKCNTLKNITSFYNIKHIDLFSLDVEGSELEVLETFDFTVSVSHWIIEWNHLSKNVKQNITSLLNKYDYYMDNIYISPIDKVFSKK